MGKRLVMGILSSVALSVGGYLSSCGSGGKQDSSILAVQMPDGCTIVSPKDELGALTAGTPVVAVQPGRNRFVLNCDGKTIEIVRDVKADQHVISISADDVR